MMGIATKVWIIVVILLYDSYKTESVQEVQPYNLTYIQNLEMRQLVWTHLQLCGSKDTCYVDLLNITWPSSVPCGACDCDNECRSRKTCCPDMYDTLEPLSNSSITRDVGMHQCVFVTVPFQNFSSVQSLKGKRLISTCPETISATDEAASELVHLCHQDYTTLWRAGLQDDAIPVTERANVSNNFKNVYCAMCQGLQRSDIVYWTVTIASNSRADLPVVPKIFHDKSSFLQELKRVVFESFQQIFLLFAPPSNVPNSVLECRVDSCNKSGLWREYDNFTERACHLYNTGFLNDTFANVFCALCNDCNGCASFIHLFNWFDFPYSYLALVDINELDPKGTRLSYDTGHQHDCGQGYWFDPIYAKCRQLYCSLLFYLHNDKCQMAYKSLQSFEYLIVQQYGLLYPQTLTKDSFETMNNTIHTQILDYLQDLYNMTGYNLIFRGLRIDHLVNIVYDWEGGTPELLEVTLVYVQVSVWVEFDMTTMSPMLTLTGMVETIEKIWNINFYPSHLVKQNFPNKTEFLTEVQNYSTLFQLLESQLQEYDSSPSGDPLYTESTTSARTTTDKIQGRPSDLQQPWEQYSAFLLPWTVFRRQQLMPDAAVLIQQSHTCVKVKFDAVDFVQNTSGNFLPALNLFIPLQPNVYNTFVENSEKQSSSAVGVCLSDYQAAIQGHLPLTTSYRYSTQTILSLACSSISAVSLVTTITVYTTIRELHTIPGLLITRTCLSLLATQLIYIITNAVHVGAVPWLCSTLGVLLHLASLTYLFWMNVGTLHMLKAFTSCALPTRTSHLPWRYTLAVHTLAALFILINIATRLIVTHGKEIGYGGDICYINTSLMIGVTFVLPLSFVVVTNTVMFILAIRSVIIADDITATSNRKYILIFTKLSTLTGISWVFGLIYQWSQLDVIGYVFIVLNASQGVFILVSFVFNKRVYAIIKKLTTSTNVSK